VKEISKSSSSRTGGWRLDSFRSHQTQAKSFSTAGGNMDEAQIEEMATSDGGWSDARILFLKSWLRKTVTEIFLRELVRCDSFTRPELPPEPARPDYRWSSAARTVSTRSFGGLMGS